MKVMVIVRQQYIRVLWLIGILSVFSMIYNGYILNAQYTQQQHEAIIQQELQDKSTQLKEAKSELQNKSTQLKEAKSELQNKSTQLKEAKSELQNKSTQLKEAKSELQLLKDTVKEKEDNLSKLEHNQNMAYNQKIKPKMYYASVASATAKNIECLAKNIYHEARGENLEGQIAVAIVTLNRVKSKHYPNTVCGVVYQYKQFSWTLNEKKITDWALYNKIAKVAKQALTDRAINPVGNALSYYAEKVRDPKTGTLVPFKKPYWASSMKKVGQIDNHIFYL